MGFFVVVVFGFFILFYFILIEWTFRGLYPTVPERSSWRIGPRWCTRRGASAAAKAKEADK